MSYLISLVWSDVISVGVFSFFYSYIHCLVVILNDLLNGNVISNFGSILNVYVWLDCHFYEVVDVCWSSLILWKGFRFSYLW